MELTVVFPVHNEEKVLAATIARALEALRELNIAFEVIIVDDASNDRTGVIADEIAGHHAEVRVLHNPVNIGQGASIVAGFRDARYSLLIHDAVDYPFDLRDTRALLQLIPEADIVVAIRKSRPGYSAYRKLASIVHLTLLHRLFGLRLRDFNFVQLYRRSVWNSLNVQARSTAFVTPEALIRAHDMRFRIIEIEVEYHARTQGAATSGRPKVVIHSLRDMLKFWWERRWASL